MKVLVLIWRNCHFSVENSIIYDEYNFLCFYCSNYA
jgi:hypothetical protein